MAENNLSHPIQTEKEVINEKKNNNRVAKELPSSLAFSKLFSVNSSQALQGILKNSFVIEADDIRDLEKNLTDFLNVNLLNTENVDSSVYMKAVYKAVSSENENNLKIEKITGLLSVGEKVTSIFRKTLENYQKNDKNNPLKTKSEKIISGILSNGGDIFDTSATMHTKIIKYKFGKSQTAEKNILKAQKTLFEAKCLREKIAILSKFIEDITLHIKKIEDADCCDDTDIVNKIEDLKNKRRGICSKLTEVIAATSALHSNLSLACKSKEDKDVIKALFDTGLNIKTIPIDSKFIEVVKNVIEEINKDALLLNATQTLKSIINENKVDIMMNGARVMLGWSLAKESLNNILYFFNDDVPKPFFKYTFAMRIIESSAKSAADIILYNKKTLDIKDNKNKNENAAIAKVYIFLTNYIDMLSARDELQKIYLEMIKSDALAAVKNADETHSAHYSFYNKILDVYATREKMVKTYHEIIEIVNMVDSYLDDKK